MIARTTINSIKVKAFLALPRAIGEPRLRPNLVENPCERQLIARPKPEPLYSLNCAASSAKTVIEYTVIIYFDFAMILRKFVQLNPQSTKGLMAKPHFFFVTKLCCRQNQSVCVRSEH